MATPPGHRPSTFRTNVAPQVNSSGPNSAPFRVCKTHVHLPRLNVTPQVISSDPNSAPSKVCKTHLHPPHLNVAPQVNSSGLNSAPSRVCKTHLHPPHLNVAPQVYISGPKSAQSRVCKTHLHPPHLNVAPQVNICGPNSAPSRVCKTHLHPPRFNVAPQVNISGPNSAPSRDSKTHLHPPHLNVAPQVSSNSSGLSLSPVSADGPCYSPWCANLVPHGQIHGSSADVRRLVVRTCRIGSSLAFGLVGVANPEPPTPPEGNIPNGNGYTDGQGLVTIRMKPDEKGRFGFNVKGGADQGMPIIVSRVAPNTPADLAIPRLNEGDQVLLINGRDVSQHTHEQVVMFIKASRETHSGELTLVVRPNVYVSEDQADEPDFSYIPETHQIASSSASANTLDSSLMLLQESLESGAAIAQFEQLYRKKPGLTLNAARLDANINKNRYRDISPYDQTRVALKNGTSGDYINANYVSMEVPGSGIVNRYIAAQGPLPNTCTDFWQMVWEQQSSLVVMLTTKVERGRVKCHQYWPQLYETEDFGTLQITCVKEEETHSFAFREFNLTHVETSEERHIRHMQYIAWPDHGVPDDPSDFLHFVIRVRQNRDGMVEPTIVHCSAGIGRTGVLITMETAMCLIESNQPVYPLTIVRQMRDQRAMLIQTSSQYKFVCEAILRVYHEGLVKPHEDFRR